MTPGGGEQDAHALAGQQQRPLFRTDYWVVRRRRRGHAGSAGTPDGENPAGQQGLLPSRLR